MKIGDYVKVEEIMNQRECRWVVLSDLVDDICGGVEGGTIAVIADTKGDSWRQEVALGLANEETLLVSGALERLNVGGVFVE